MRPEELRVGFAICGSYCTFSQVFPVLEQLAERYGASLTTVRRTLALLEEKGADTSAGVVLVSSGFHLARIKMLWARAGGQADNVSTLAAPVSHVPSAVQMFFREPLALVKSFVFDR